MLGNLKSKKFVDSLHGPHIGRMNSDPASRVHRLKVIVNLIAQLLHRWYARWRLVMNEHWNVEIAS